MFGCAHGRLFVLSSRQFRNEGVDEWVKFVGCSLIRGWQLSTCSCGTLHLDAPNIVHFDLCCVSGLVTQWRSEENALFADTQPEG